MTVIKLSSETVADVRDLLMTLLSGKQYRSQMFDFNGRESLTEVLSLSEESFADDNAPIYFHDRTGGIVLHISEGNSTDQAFIDGDEFIFGDHFVVILHDQGFRRILTIVPEEIQR